MDMRHVLLPLVTLLSASLGAESSTCPSSCPPCPAAPACLAPHCPAPVCPPLPAVPPCPAVRCPTPPEVPDCPTPELHLSCPHATCPPQSCPSCPACPNIPSCPACSSPSAPSPPRTLPPGYEYKTGHGAYKYFGTPTSWGSANTTCSLDGGYLAVPKTQEELVMLLRYMRSSFLHVGFHDSAREGSWVTVLGQPLDAIQKNMWSSNNHSNPNEADCAYLSRLYEKLADGRCGDYEDFVCEVPYT